LQMCRVTCACSKGMIGPVRVNPDMLILRRFQADIRRTEEMECEWDSFEVLVFLLKHVRDLV